MSDAAEGDGTRKSLEIQNRTEGVSPARGEGPAIKKNGANEESNLRGGVTLNLGSKVGSPRQRPSNGPDSPRPPVSFLSTSNGMQSGGAMGNDRYEVYMENEDENDT